GELLLEREGLQAPQGNKTVRLGDRTGHCAGKRLTAWRERKCVNDSLRGYARAQELMRIKIPQVDAPVVSAHRDKTIIRGKGAADRLSRRGSEDVFLSRTSQALQVSPFKPSQVRLSVGPPLFE